MGTRSRYPLSDAEKDDLLDRQADLIRRMAARIEALEAALHKPKKTSSNAHTPPSQDGPGKANRPGGAKKRRPSRPGFGRALAETPDATERHFAQACPHCAGPTPHDTQRCRYRYDHIDIPPIRPVVTRVELFGGRCQGCGHRYRAAPPAEHPPGSPFGKTIEALLLYWHHSHHIGFERLSRMARELLGLAISEGAIANAFRRAHTPMSHASAAIQAELVRARVIASDETTTRVNGQTQWQWVFSAKRAVLHKIVPSRARHIAQTLLGAQRPAVWISDRYAGQQDLADQHQVCLAHVLRDVQYAIDSGDTVFAPQLRQHLVWAVRVGKRRAVLADSSLATYAARAERRLDQLLRIPAAHPAGAALQRAVKLWRGKFFVFLADREVPATNNRSEQAIRPSVVFRKVTNGFRSSWGADIHAGYRSVTGTARLYGASAIAAITDLVHGRFTIPDTG